MKTLSQCTTHRFCGVYPATPLYHIKCCGHCELSRPNCVLDARPYLLKSLYSIPEPITDPRLRAVSAVETQRGTRREMCLQGNVPRSREQNTSGTQHGKGRWGGGSPDGITGALEWHGCPEPRYFLLRVLLLWGQTGCPTRKKGLAYGRPAASRTRLATVCVGPHVSEMFRASSPRLSDHAGPSPFSLRKLIVPCVQHWNAAFLVSIKE